MIHETTLSRRRFLKQASLAVAAAPTIVPSTVFGATAPSHRVAIGHIGVGTQGGGLLGGFLGVAQGQSVAICDAFQERREAAARRVDERYAAEPGRSGYKGCKTYRDFRELLGRGDVDAVVVATPDHWHVPIALAAVRAGKDVYVEKPLGISIEHDQAMRAAVHRHAAVFQYGTQQRSFSRHCGFACELVRNGYLGELKEIHVVAPNGGKGGKPLAEPVPQGLDYDMWLGPAPVTPYAHDRVIGTGRYHIYDYALGFIAGWGAHPLDIAHWGYPFIPVEYTGTGVVPTEGLFDTVMDWDVRGRYASGVQFTLRPGQDSTTFVGSQGWVRASRAGITAEPASLLTAKIKPDEIHLLQGPHHYANFVECVATRKTPVSHIDSAVQSDFISQLSDIAIRTGRTIRWDPRTETILDDAVASRMQSRAMREPWTL
jgi:hypothetical protein